MSRRNKVMRKVVPRRRFDMTTVSGRIKRHAYDTDMTRAELAQYFGVSKQALNKWLITKPTMLNAFHIRGFSAALGLDAKETQYLLHLLQEGRT